jgi:hypothetical protein
MESSKDGPTFRREDGAVEWLEGPSDLDRLSVKEHTARRKLSPVLPTTAGDGIGRARRDELHHLVANLQTSRSSGADGYRAYAEKDVGCQDSANDRR